MFRRDFEGPVALQVMERVGWRAGVAFHGDIEGTMGNAPKCPGAL